MLTRNSPPTELSNTDDYYNNSLVKIPTLSDSVYHNFSAGFATPIVAADAFNTEMAKSPEGKATRAVYDSANLENSTPGMGWPQKTADFMAGMIGYGLNPITWIGGLAGRAVGGAVASAVEAAAPKAASVLARSPLSLSSYGAATGASVPAAVAENYNQDTNHIAWGGVATDAMEMGGFGLAIDAIPYAYGLIKSRLNRGNGTPLDTPVDTKALDTARDAGHITDAEHAWYTDLLANQKNPTDTKTTEDLKARATDLISQRGFEVNSATQKASFPILTPDDVTHLQGALADQIVSDLPDEHKTTLTDFIANNRLQDITSDPSQLDGVRGYVDFINQKLANKTEKLAEHDAILDNHLLRGAKENMPFSQKQIFKFMKQNNFEPNSLSQLPLTIPENLHARVRGLDKINQLKVKLKVAAKKGHPENKQTVKRIGELEAKLPKILTPKEELQQLRDRLLSEKGLPKHFQLSEDYHRLMDLTNAWHNARTLLDRVHVEHEYNRQEAFKNVADGILKTADSGVGKMIQPENVMDYLRQRIEGSLSKVADVKDAEQAVTESQKLPPEPDNVLAEQARQTEKTKAEDMKKDLELVTDKFKEFKGAGAIFKNLISCVAGTLNG